MKGSDKAVRGRGREGVAGAEAVSSTALGVFTALLKGYYHIQYISFYIACM